MKQYKEKQSVIRHCKRCGEEIGKSKQYCEECRKIIASEYFKNWYLKRHGVKEKRKEKQPTVRYCKRCGKEVGKSKHYCEECLTMNRKEFIRKYYGKPENKEKRKEYCREYYRRKKAEVKQGKTKG
jgi:predicted amidophosphoribosyltransferase